MQLPIPTTQHFVTISQGAHLFVIVLQNAQIHGNQKAQTQEQEGENVCISVSYLTAAAICSYYPIILI